jgi:hypothetical protein
VLGYRETVGCCWRWFSVEEADFLGISEMSGRDYEQRLLDLARHKRSGAVEGRIRGIWRDLLISWSEMLPMQSRNRPNAGDQPGLTATSSSARFAPYFNTLPLGTRNTRR